MSNRKKLPFNLGKQFRMTSGSCQPEQRVFNFINEKPIGADMKFAISLPIAAQTMVSELNRNLNFFKKHVNASERSSILFPCASIFLTSFKKRLEASMLNILYRLPRAILGNWKTSFLFLPPAHSSLRWFLCLGRMY